MMNASAMDDAEKYLWPQESGRLSMREVNSLLMHCVGCEASDITMKTGLPVMLKRHGRFHQATRGALSASESLEVLSAVFKSESGAAKINSMDSLNFAYEIKVGRGERRRFRVHAGACEFQGGSGIHLTMRPMNATPPTLGELGVEQELIDAFGVGSGMMVVSGSTGSGKSTMIASCIRWMLEKPWSNTKVMTIEDPIEYLFDEFSTPTSFAVQTEINRHCLSFHDGVHDCMRQNPSAILIGETRSRETLDACVWAATSGQVAMTTLHASGVAGTLRRMVSFHPEPSQAVKWIEAAEALSLVVSQKLVPSLDGRRVALREFLPINGAVKQALLNCPVGRISELGVELVAKHGQSFRAAAKHAYRVEKSISKEVFEDQMALLEAEG